MHTHRPHKVRTDREHGVRTRNTASGWMLFGHFYECIVSDDDGIRATFRFSLHRVRTSRDASSVLPAEDSPERVIEFFLNV